MQSSLIPERPLVISPTLAATIGLEEAVMLHVLSELMVHRAGRQKDGLSWVELSQETLTTACPFWAPIDLQRALSSLQEKGIILIEQQSGASYYAVDERDARSGVSDHVVPAPANYVSSPEPKQEPLRHRVIAPEAEEQGARNIFDTGGVNGAGYIPPDWQPSADWIKQCRQHNIPESFLLQRVEGFVLYWRERKQARFSWGNTFYKFVVREWANEKTRKGMSELETTMSPQWWPSTDAISILENADVSTAFIEDAVPEFVLYWRERGAEGGAWNTRFIEHIRRQWAKYSATVGVDTLPRMIAPDWQPSVECFDILHLAEIDEEFARGKVQEFVLYWRDAKQTHASWNTRFLQYIKYQWARRLESAASVTNEKNKSLVGEDSQSIGSAYERFTDRSWAE